MATKRSRRAARPRRPPSVRSAREASASLISTLLMAAVLAAAAAWAYSTSFAGVFVLDDKFAIADNPHIKTLWPLTRAMSAPPESPVSGRPIASLTLAINYALAPDDVRDVLSAGGPKAPAGWHERFLRNVWGYHFLNLILHVSVGLALFGVVRRTLRSDVLGQPYAAVSTPVAFAIALIWLVHPLLTDAVTYVVQRTEVLMGLFYVLTLYCAIRAGERSMPESRRRWWMTGAIASCALGMGSKQTMVSAPLIVLLWDWMFGPADVSGRAYSRLRWRFYAGLAATWIILAALVAMERWPHSIGLAREGWTPWTYLLTQTGVIVHYLRLSFVPTPLVLDYEGWPMARAPLQVWPQAALLMILFGAAVVGILRRWPWAFAGAWFFALLGPSSSVLPLATEIAAERRMYLPLAAVVAVVVVAAHLLGRNIMGATFRSTKTRHQIALVSAVGLVGAVAIALGAATYDRNRDYWSDIGIWRDTVAKRPTNSRARVNYAVDLQAEGQLDAAERELREAVRLKETNAAAHANLGPILCATGRLDEGIAHLERALALDPDYSSAHGNLGEAYASRGQRARAAREFARAVEAAPQNSFMLNRLAWLLATSPEDSVRDGPRAVELAERAAALTARQDTMSLDTLSAAYAETGRFDRAVATCQEAIDLAERQGDRAGAADLLRRLRVFKAGQRYREIE